LNIPHRLLLIAALTFVSVSLANAQAAAPEPTIADLTKAIQTNPADPQNYYLRSQAYAAQKKFDLALADAGKLIELLPKDSRRNVSAAYAVRGVIYRQQGKLTEALNDFDTASRTFPDITATVNRVEILLDQGKEPDESDLIQASTNTNNPRFYLARGDRFLKQGKYAFALNLYNDYLKHGGDKKTGLQRRLQVFCKSGDTSSVNAFAERTASGQIIDPCK
jgi:tetratricopeptide (TPR) repeat protein